MTQDQLATRLGVTQPAISALERSGSNPRISTVAAVLAATGHRLQLIATPVGPGVDPTLIRRHLAESMEQRIRGLETMHAEARVLATSIRRHRAR